ncbi:hypothetical protein K503DRAFT_733073 [Rhizopogon vinicolor AM-OR11-026]|uniref:MYND-type domain-containing protein n=1 Tax=Rhizopogon vinicolor AM-OR11-026 TaxID=1314800 RepID=A0A1B7NCX5_9AGAM|nr:hypothetical protein K503DRAFT_733073 [Rhizopogon vinicolor AM-OR11-026]
MIEEISYTLDDSAVTPDDIEAFHSDLRRTQEATARSLRSIFFDQGHFDTIWLLLSTSEQGRHILEGLKKTCADVQTLWGPDSRAFCPEITVTNLLSQGGKGFVDFLTRTLEVLESPNKPAFLPNPWWDEAQHRSRGTEIIFEITTITRNKFIAYFVLASTGSIVNDIVKRSEGMKPVLDIMENSDGLFAQSLAMAKTTLRDKPLVRCENCTKSSEGFEPPVRFMVCSTCKSKLAFEVHYCSRTCQQEDWSVHKRTCGKKKVSKGLSGTKEDDLWAFTDPVTAMIRNSRNQDGHVALRDIGLGAPTAKRSPAAELQAEMLEANRDVDYFLFTASGKPVRFVIDDSAAKITFKIVRGMVPTQPAETPHLGAMAEYMLKLMSGYPGLSRDIILKQLCAE